MNMITNKLEKELESQGYTGDVFKDAVRFVLE